MNKESGVFRYKGFEYKIDRKRIYSQRRLLKLGFWCMYLEGNPNPIEFDDKGMSIPESDFPIDEIAMIINKVIHGVMEILMLVLVGFNIVLSVAIAFKVFQ